MEKLRLVASVEAQCLEPAPDVLAALRGRLCLPQPLQVGVQVVADADELGILADAPLGAQAVGRVRLRDRAAGDPAPGRQRLGDAHGDGWLASQHRGHLQAVEELGEEGRQIELRLGCQRHVEGQPVERFEPAVRARWQRPGIVACSPRRRIRRPDIRDNRRIQSYSVRFSPAVAALPPRSRKKADRGVGR